MKNKHDEFREFAKIRSEVVTAIQSFIETDLSIIETFIQTAQQWYRLKKRADAERAMAAGKKGIDTIQRALSTNYSFDPQFKARSLSHCMQLEYRLLTIKQQDAQPS